MKRKRIVRREILINGALLGLPNHDEWELAKGSAHLNIGDTPVYGIYLNGVALFAYSYRNSLGHLTHCCGVTGQMTCGGKTLHEAMDAGAMEALKWGVLEADRRYSREQFRQIMENPEKLK